MIWLGLEINIISFIILIYQYQRIKHIESCLKYFFVQSLGSAIFLRIFYLNLDILKYLGRIVLRYKIGAGPFYFWFPSVCSGIGWISCFFLISFQKIIPLVLINIFIRWIIWFIIVISLLYGALGSFNQNQIKRLLAFSSIHHIGWLLICELFEDIIWIIYLILYRIIILGLIYFLYYYEINNIINILKLKDKRIFVLLVLRIAGIPPLLGFFLKWIGFYFILKINFFIIIFIIFISVLIFYVYIRLLYDFILGIIIKGRWINNKLLNKYFLRVDIFRRLRIIFRSFFILILLL